MAVTSNTFTGDGSTTNYSFTFEYLEQDEVKVTLDGVSTTAFTFANATTLSFNTAPTNGAEIRIYRDTNIDNLKATFFPGSAIKAEDLNNNFIQNNFVVQEIQNNTWDVDLQTIKSNETWVSSDTQIATTAAMDARFQDEAIETIESTETWVADDAHIATTQAIENRIDEVITNDIGTDGTGITVTDDGDGTITLGLADNSIDFSKIKNEDIITYAEQNAGSPSWDSDNRLATAYAAARRFDTLVQQAIPTGSDWEVGKTWLQNDQDLTLSIWNGINWLAIASGGAFINQPKVVYVDASSGADTNDGHRISRPKKTIKAAINQINSDSTYGDGSVVVVAPGVYQEAAPIDILKKDVGIIGTALRSCVIHPTAATETNSLFRVNSGTFLQNLTFTGVKASGSRGGAGSVDPDTTYGVPVTQGWNVSFYPNATIVKSPYIQNCTNFSDSEINNSSLDPHNPAGGAGGDTDSAVTGGGLLVDGSVVNSNSPLRSMVCDSYTHVGLDGPGILVTNNGYAQCTSSYAFFNHYHIKCLNGGQANLAASTTDFGRYGLIADGRSPSAIFTATTTVAANDGDITFTIGAPTAQAGWHGSATRPQSNMLVDIGGNTYPILSASANGSGWDVTISRPDPADRANNLGLDGAVANGSAVSFYLRSMIASSGHTMEYVGSGTNYTALPENGGVPIEANQVVELNDGKVWTATTDHNGKFKVGDFFTVDQQNSSISVASGSFQVNLGTLAVDGTGNAVIGAPLDLNGNAISDSTGSVTIADTLDVNGNKIVNVTDPTLAQDAATKNYVDSTFVELQGDTMTGALALPSGTAAAPSLSVGTTDNGIYSPGADQLAISTNGTGRLFVDASGNVQIAGNLQTGVSATTGQQQIRFNTQNTYAGQIYSNNLENLWLIGGAVYDGTNYVANTGTTAATMRIVQGSIRFEANSGLTPSGNFTPQERLRITSAGLVGIGTSSPASLLDLGNTVSAQKLLVYASGNSRIGLGIAASEFRAFAATGSKITFGHVSTVDGSTFTERAVITSAGNVGIGTTSPSTKLQVASPNSNTAETVAGFGNQTIANGLQITTNGNLDWGFNAANSRNLTFSTNQQERARIDSSGRLLVGTSSSTTIGAYTNSLLQVKQDNSSTQAGLSITAEGSSGTTFPRLLLSRSNTGATAVIDNSNLGLIQYAGYDSAGNYIPAAWIQASVDGTPGANDMPGRLVFSVTADGASSPTERMRISSDGRTNFTGFVYASTSVTPVSTVYENLQITNGGFVSTGGSATTTAGFESTINSTSTRYHLVFSNPNGVVGSISTSASATAYNTSSDYRLKENVTPVTDGITRLQQLKPSRFNFIADPNTVVDGFLAHEVQTIVPEAITGEKDAVDDEGNPEYQGIDQSKLVPLLTAALQEAVAKIESLEQRLANAGIA